jgi:hypothetical protein
MLLPPCSNLRPPYSWATQLERGACRIWAGAVNVERKYEDKDLVSGCCTAYVHIYCMCACICVGTWFQASAQCSSTRVWLKGLFQNMSFEPSVENQNESGIRSVHHCQSQIPSYKKIACLDIIRICLLEKSIPLASAAPTGWGSWADRNKSAIAMRCTARPLRDSAPEIAWQGFARAPGP